MFVSTRTYQKEVSPPSDAIFGDKIAMGQDICDRGRELGDEGAGSGDRRGWKRGSSTP